MAGYIDVIVIGAGHCGLAMSAVLSERGIDHVVLERSEIANTWRTERWDSLRLLTPNWLTRLPGYSYPGDADGYMTSADLCGFLENYAKSLAAPVVAHTAVLRVTHDDDGYRVATSQGEWRCRALVLATGAFNQPDTPRIAQGVPGRIEQLHALNYRNPEQLAPGRVLIVGGSATGVQLAHELQRSGRPVTLAVGEHVRMPRVYRGRDVQWWMLASGLLERRIEEEEDPDRARRVPSPQLTGSPGFTLDLNALREQGVEIVGRLVGIRDGKAQFSGSLRNTCTLADLKLNRLLNTFDEWLEHRGRSLGITARERFAPTAVDETARLGIDLREDVRTVLWATGYRPDYSWLKVPVVNAKGELRHDRGVVAAPGLYVLGLPYLRRRKSSFIHGAEDDARELGAHLMQFLDGSERGRSGSSVAPRSLQSSLPLTPVRRVGT
ncbi:MAG TPA: NAD(P)-binding domain-containing protein [Polyangiaceae bacterium]|nr:NAD(P)-binding domain-containing protein [Polyangiaceae bacterium]